MQIWRPCCAIHPAKQIGESPQEDREVFPDVFAAKDGEDRRPPDQACSVLLALVGRRALDEAPVRQYAAVDRGFAGASGVEIGR